MRFALFAMCLSLAAACGDDASLRGQEDASFGEDVHAPTPVAELVPTLDGAPHPSAPEVVDALPGALSLAPDDVIVRLVFSTSMDPTRTGDVFELRHSDDESPVSGELAWDATHTVLAFRPTRPLVAGSTYDVVLSAAAESAVGVRLGADFALSFKVALDSDPSGDSK